MSALSPPLRRQLERAVLAARTAAETGARKALDALGVNQEKPPRHLTSTQVVSSDFALEKFRVKLPA